LLPNILRRFARICILDACVQESGFVNHSAVSVPNQLCKAFRGGRRCGVPTLSPRGEEGALHARFAD
ncbi:MAG: hypothetical protein WA230_15355, partial [Xanthobacteraceae bacterium]